MLWSILISLAAAKPLWDLSITYHWNRPPSNATSWDPPPVRDYLRKILSHISEKLYVEELKHILAACLKQTKLLKAKWNSSNQHTSTWQGMPACAQMQRDGMHTPTQSHPQTSLDSRVSLFESFSSESIFCTPDILREKATTHVGAEKISQKNVDCIFTESDLHHYNKQHMITNSIITFTKNGQWTWPSC